jgi:hypothetical protein
LPSGDTAEAANETIMDGEHDSVGEKSGDELDRIGSGTQDTGFAPIANLKSNEEQHDAAAEKRLSRRSHSRSHSLERSWSLNDGVSVGGNEIQGEANGAGQDADGDQGYTVRWEENDPMNPRNMSKARRWMIVIIVSMGSLCV